MVGAPSLWTPLLEQAPIGSASVLYTSNTWFSDRDLLAGLVGAGDDVYRVYTTDGEAAGMGEILSPDGTRAASSLGIHDLATDVLREYPPAWKDLWVRPQAWSPDGATIAVLVEVGDTGSTGVDLLVPGTGEIRELARIGGDEPLPGWTVAFSPDGTRLAVQNGAAVRVITLDAAGAGVDVPLPAGARLAGKGAWSSDGANLLVVSGASCGCAGYPVRWTVTEIAAYAGTPTGRSWSRDGVFALRVLGWWPSGEPVAAEYTAAAGTPPTFFGTGEEQSGLTSQNAVDEARLIGLDSGRVLLAGAGMPLGGGDVESFDVADRVLASGAVRAGDPPLFTMGLLVFLPLTVIGISIAAVLTILLWWLIIRWWAIIGDHESARPLR
ncbi:hypothetical protein GCM10009828_072820 [Actinoplanes couchii]|uniref:WD40 repeat domain-containing protein n=1 Tax=Actinoplanes couchii TaxID=403638 RepID=A0ABQ3X0L5_9ACTN|nr:hypothetical protein Aco03nite_004110 [Actinoplanes couchii]